MMAGIYSSFGFCRATFIAHIAAHVQDLGFSLTDGANVLAVLTGWSIIGRIGMGRLADMIGNRAAFMISFAVTTVILTYGLRAQDLWELYLFGAVFGFAWGAQAVLRFAITSEVFGLASLGLVMGVLGFAEYGTAAVGAYIAGYVFDVVGTYRPVFLMGMAVSATGILIAWLLKPAMRKDVGMNVPSP
jgi:MFS family permease